METLSFFFELYCIKSHHSIFKLLIPPKKAKKSPGKSILLGVYYLVEDLGFAPAVLDGI